MSESEDPRTVLSIHVDAARARVAPHTVHLELAASQADGRLVPVLSISFSPGFAAELRRLLELAITRADELKRAIADGPGATDREIEQLSEVFGAVDEMI